MTAALQDQGGGLRGGARHGQGQSRFVRAVGNTTHIPSHSRQLSVALSRLAVCLSEDRPLEAKSTVWRVVELCREYHPSTWVAAAWSYYLLGMEDDALKMAQLRNP
jgi:hypothetical protein